MVNRYPTSTTEQRQAMRCISDHLNYSFNLYKKMVSEMFYQRKTKMFSNYKLSNKSK